MNTYTRLDTRLDTATIPRRKPSGARPAIATNDFGELIMPEEAPEPETRPAEDSTPVEAEGQNISKSEIEERAQELKDSIQMPKKPGTKVSFRELKAWLNLLTKEQEERVVIYVYRLTPSIVRQKSNPDNPNNIDVISTNLKDLTEDYIARTQGGGKYKLIVKDVFTIRRGKTSKAAAEGEGYIECEVYLPPSVHKFKMMHIDGCGIDLREVVWDEIHNTGFRDWCRANGYLSNENKPTVPNTGGGQVSTAAPNVELTQMFKMMMDFVGKMSEKDQATLKKQLGGEDALTKSMGDLMLEKMRQEDPTKQMQSMIGLISAVTANSKGNGDSLGPIMTMFTTLITSMMDQSNKTFQMMMTVLNKQSESANNTGEKEGELDKLRAIIELSKEIKTGGASAHMTTTDRVVDAISGLAMPVITLVGNIVQANTLAKAGKVVPIEPQAPMGTMEHANQANREAMQSQQANPQAKPAQIGDSEMVSILRQFAAIIFQNMGKKGWEFAEWIEEGYGAPTVALIIKDGPDVLLHRLKQVGQVMIPQAGGMVDFWQVVMTTYGDPYLRKWVDEFCNYKEIIENMEVEEHVNDAQVQ